MGLIVTSLKASVCRDPSGDWRFHARTFEKSPIREACDRRTDQREDPEHPELLERPRTNEDCRPGAARGIHRRVRHGNADQVDEGECKPYRDTSKTYWSSVMRGSQNHDEEHERHHELAHRAR